MREIENIRERRREEKGIYMNTGGQRVPAHPEDRGEVYTSLDWPAKAPEANSTDGLAVFSRNFSKLTNV